MSEWYFRVTNCKHFFNVNTWKNINKKLLKNITHYHLSIGEKMKLNKTERKSFWLIMPALMLNAFALSIGAFQDIIAKKALSAEDWQITLLSMVWAVTIFFSIWWGNILEQSDRKTRFFWWIAFGGRLILLTCLWISNFTHLFIMLFIMYSFNSLFMPLQNSLLQNSFNNKVRGKVFGIITSIVTIVTMSTSYIAGRILDYSEHDYKKIFFAIGILSFIGVSLLSFVRTFKKSQVPKVKKTLPEILLRPIKRTVLVLREDKDFAHFELSFFTYGMGFIMVVPVLPLFLVGENYLNLDYSHSFLAKGILMQLGMLFLSPIAGRVHDKINPIFFTGFSFLLMALYPTFLLFSLIFVKSGIAVVLMYIACVFYGVAMSGLNISWNIGSIYFAGDNDASMYQSVHVTLTGLRGFFAPFLGFAILKLFGMEFVFIFAALLQFLAAGMNFFRCRKRACACIADQHKGVTEEVTSG